MNAISTLTIAVVVSSLLFLSLPENGFAGTPSIPPLPGGCCQYFNQGDNVCAEISSGLVCPVLDIGAAIDFVPMGSCDQDTGLCSGPGPVARNVPTISQWGLISLVIVLAIAGIGAFLAGRKKTV